MCAFHFSTCPLARAEIVNCTKFIENPISLQERMCTPRPVLKLPRKFVPKFPVMLLTDKHLHPHTPYHHHPSNWREDRDKPVSGWRSKTSQNVQLFLVPCQTYPEYFRSWVFHNFFSLCFQRNTSRVDNGTFDFVGGNYIETLIMFSWHTKNAFQ